MGADVMRLLNAGLLLVAAVLSGCQTAEQSQVQYSAQLNGVMASLPGQTVGEFSRRNPQLYAAGGYDLGGERVFIYETAPVVVTATLPPYTPAPRRFNDPAMGKAYGNLSAAVGTVPAVSRSTVLVCRITITATRIADASSPDSWRITNATAQGRNC